MKKIVYKSDGTIILDNTKLGMTGFTMNGYTMTSDTLAYFKLDNTSYNSVNDVSGTTYNVSYTTGKVGNCAFFASGATYATQSGIKYDLDLEPITGDFTVSFWVKIRNTPSGDRIIVAKETQGVNYPPFNVRAGTDNKPYLMVCNRPRSATPSASVKSTTPISTSVFNNYVFTRDGTNIYVYCNGIYQTRTSWTRAQGNTSDPITIGNGWIGDVGAPYPYWRQDGTSAFDGWIDEVIIEKVAWGGAKVYNYYSAGGNL